MKIDELFSEALDLAVPETWTTLDSGQLDKVKKEYFNLIMNEVKDAIIDTWYSEALDIRGGCISRYLESFDEYFENF